MNVQRATAVFPAGSRIAPKVAWLLCGLALAFIACAVAFGVLNRGGLWESIRLLALVSSALVGGVVASRRSANPVGWFLLISAACFAVVVFAEEYATYGLLTEPGSLPLARAMAWPPRWLWVAGAVPIFVFLPLYFPEGRLVSPRWRWVVWFAAFFSIFGAVLSAFQPGDVQGTGLVNPLGVEALGSFPAVIDAAILPLWLGLLSVSAASLVVRFRRSGTEQRQQIKWLAFAASAIPAWFLVSPFFEETIPVLFEIGETLVFAGVPVAVGIAVLKYRLYDIDLVINRTLVYGTLTACVVALYVLVVGYLGTVFQVEDNLLVSLVATGLVAVAFAPLRDRLQRGVNRLMYGERDDPYAVLSRLGERLKAATAPQAVLPTIIETVAQELKLPYAAIALKRDDGAFETVAARGHPEGEPLVLPLSYGAETIGQLVLSPRAPGESFGPADRRLLEDLARHAEAAAYAVRLTADLQRSRERLVNAREEERRRLRRDLHDGLGPQLATLTLKLDAARNLLSQEELATADALLAELKGQTQAAISDIRRLVYDLRPPTLDELGLIPAIREQATNYSQNGLNASVEATEQMPPLPAAVEVAAYRIVQEALTNVSRHARARACRVRLSIDEELELEITDDGVGLPADLRAGVGLASMRERAAELGGTCTAEPLTTGGTRVFARLPLPTSSGERP